LGGRLSHSAAAFDHASVALPMQIDLQSLNSGTVTVRAPTGGGDPMAMSSAAAQEAAIRVGMHIVKTSSNLSSRRQNIGRQRYSNNFEVSYE
jgi:hypothetical protein